jgi:hypothetical protein
MNKNSKKVEEKTNPGRCLRNLKEYHDAMIGLYTYVQAVMEWIPKEAQKTMQEKLNAVKEFHNAE